MGQSTFVEPLESRRFLNVALDPTFGTDGVLNLGAGGITARATTNDGKILVAGALQVSPGGTSIGTVARPFVARLRSDGTLDSSFGGVSHGQRAGTPDGTVVFFTSRTISKINQIVSLPDGSMLLAGASKSGQVENGALVKLRSDGNLATGFGGPARGFANSANGSLFYDPGIFADSYIAGAQFRYVAVAADGRIAVDGTQIDKVTASSPSPVTNEIVMFNSDGSFDTNFGPSGVYAKVGSMPSEDLEAMAFGADGSLVVADAAGVGSTNNSNPSQMTSGQLTLIELESDGTVGPAAESTVFSLTAVGRRPVVEGDELQSLSDGSFLLLSRQQKNIAVYHILSDLTSDESFGGGAGVVEPSSPGNAELVHSSLAILPDGRFCVGAIDDSGLIQLFRYLPDGTIDPVFGSGVIAAAASSTELITPLGDDLVLATQVPGAQSDSIQVMRAQGGVRMAISPQRTLLVGGTSQDDSISLSIRKSDGSLIARVGDVSQSFKPSQIKRISIYSYGGDDSIVIGAGIRAVFADGGAGKDTLTGGDGNDTLVGNTGNDDIDGGAGDDSISGGGGNDYLLGGIGNDTLAGNGGHDTLSGAAGNDVLFGGPGFADTINGGKGTDLAAQDFSDTYHDVETLV